MPACERYADPEAMRKAVREYAQQLRGLHPEIERIRWFGSWVTRVPRPGSDVDLCITVRSSDEKPRDRIARYLPERFPVSIDLFVYTPEEEREMRKRHPTFAKAIDAGIEV